MEISAYLQRIKYEGSMRPEPGTLRDLQLAHLRSVPFENLDIHLARPITLDLPYLFNKIIKHRRGGFCYELNGLFAWLLRELGFDVTLLSASDAKNDGSFGPEFDHLALLVQCPAQIDSSRWLADVGWGDSFTEPLPLDETGDHEQGLRAYRLEKLDGYRLLWQRNYDGTWEKQYRFSLQPREFADFEAMCRYHQTSPESHFTRGRICTLATEYGRISLSESLLITTENGKRQERVILCEHEYQSIFEGQFGIILPQKKEYGNQ
jgi:N-hydroxyarylamine O-acetyltransferase